VNEANATLAYDAFLVEEPNRKYVPLDTLVEAEVSRFWRWITGGAPYGMISAEKHEEEFTTEINRSRSAKLSIELAKQRLGGILIKGYFKEPDAPAPVGEIS
jgi:hypothetical protein